MDTLRTHPVVVVASLAPDRPHPIDPGECRRGRG